jgi:hypothetical protein
VTHVKAALVQQEVIIFTIGFLVKFKRSFRAPREPWALWLGEAMVAILDFLSPPKTSYISQIYQNLLGIWSTLAKQHFPCCPSYLFILHMQQLRHGHSCCSVQIKSDLGTV